MHTSREADRRARRNSVHAGAERRAAPDRAAALGQYRARAAVYDFEISAVEPMRRRAIERLGLSAGEVVIDAGCGTGLSLIALARAVGESGAVIGVEQSPEMIRRARDRIAAARLTT
ncbi:methyltransferase domain-containing protein [bacterium]|nr:methyltransferase domain-containing protein [bacterium]